MSRNRGLCEAWKETRCLWLSIAPGSGYPLKRVARLLGAAEPSLIISAMLWAKPFVVFADPDRRRPSQANPRSELIETLVEIEFAADSLLEEAVSSELVSEAQIPC